MLANASGVIALCLAAGLGSGLVGCGRPRDAEAIEPEAVAQAVLRAINDGTFWIMTHPRYVDLVKTRAEGMLTGAMPPIPHPI